MARGKLVVTVTDSTSSLPISNAKVTITDAVSGSITERRTDSNGKARFDLEAGSYGASTSVFETMAEIPLTSPITVVGGQTEDASLMPNVQARLGTYDEGFGSLQTTFTEGNVVGLRASPTSQTSPPTDDFNYAWNVNSGSIVEQPSKQNEPEVHWDSTGLRGVYTATVTMTDTDRSAISVSANVTVLPRPVQRIDTVPVTLRRSSAQATTDQALWVAIRNRTTAIAFNGSGYKDFIDRVLCQGEIVRTGSSENALVLRRQYDELHSAIHGVGAYELLKTATQAFLLLQCGLIIEPNDAFTGEPLYNPAEEATRLGTPISLTEIQRRLTDYLGGDKLPYIKRIVETTLVGLNGVDNAFCDGYLNGRINPCMMELIWSYWQEEGMLVQAINAISLRFQNRRSMSENDPLAHLEISPLRTLNNLLWGYIQDEQHRLTVLRRAHEYDHHYGLTLYGKAVGNLRAADSRPKFLEAYHNLLHLATVFYKQADDTTVVADGFPVLSGLREVHLELARGAHNQFGDLPWTARAEMLLQQWLLARPEMREFLQSRAMVPYKEPWMPQVDTMRTLQGWGDVTVSHFHDLAVYGEQILLSVRYADWIGVNDPAQAANWAQYWRPEIQGYIHAYRAATGVDLTAAATDSRQAALRVTQPSELLRQRLQGNGAMLPSPTAKALPTPQTFRERRMLRRG